MFHAHQKGPGSIRISIVGSNNFSIKNLLVSRGFIFYFPNKGCRSQLYRTTRLSREEIISGGNFHGEYPAKVSVAFPLDLPLEFEKPANVSSFRTLSRVSDW